MYKSRSTFFPKHLGRDRQLVVAAKKYNRVVPRRPRIRSGEGLTQAVCLGARSGHLGKITARGGLLLKRPRPARQRRTKPRPSCDDQLRPVVRPRGPSSTAAQQLEWKKGPVHDDWHWTLRTKATATSETRASNDGRRHDVLGPRSPALAATFAQHGGPPRVMLTMRDPNTQVVINDEATAGSSSR